MNLPIMKDTDTCCIEGLEVPINDINQGIDILIIGLATRYSSAKARVIEIEEVYL